MKIFANLKKVEIDDNIFWAMQCNIDVEIGE